MNAVLGLKEVNSEKGISNDDSICFVFCFGVNFDCVLRFLNQGVMITRRIKLLFFYNIQQTVLTIGVQNVITQETHLNACIWLEFWVTRFAVFTYLWVKQEKLVKWENLVSFDRVKVSRFHDGTPQQNKRCPRAYLQACSQYRLDYFLMFFAEYLLFNLFTLLPCKCLLIYLWFTHLY